MKNSSIRKLVLWGLPFLALIALFTLSRKSEPETENNQTIALHFPAFVQAVQADASEVTAFPDDEAGMSAYFQASGTIDLNDVRSLYRTIEVETSDYILGSIAVPGYANESEDVHVYIHVDGWVMAYYLAADPAAKIIDWQNYDGITITTKFENVLTMVAASLSITLPTVEYYDFRHPNATNLMLIAEAQYGSGSDSFDVNLPVSLTYYERSWSINCQHWWGQYYLNDVLIIQVGCPGSNSIWENTEGIFTQVELPPDIYNTIRMDSGGGNVFGGLALVYMVP